MMATKKQPNIMPVHTKKEVLEIDLTIPTDGLLKIRFHDTNATHSLFGTLIVGKDGVVVMEVNQKKAPEKMVSWSTLARIMSMGFIK